MIALVNIPKDFILDLENIIVKDALDYEKNNFCEFEDEDGKKAISEIFKVLQDENKSHIFLDLDMGIESVVYICKKLGFFVYQFEDTGYYMDKNIININIFLKHNK